MYTIDINCSSPYRVHIGTMLLEQSGELIRDACRGSRAAVITDTNVGPLYAHIVTKSLAEAGYTTCVHMFEAGEEHKRADTLIEILEFIAENELGRKDVVVALGGGVVGDVAASPQRPTCAAYGSPRFPRAFWPWSIPRWAERPPSTLQRARTLQAPSGSRASSSRRGLPRHPHS